jgi:hypothetical protein
MPEPDLRVDFTGRVVLVTGAGKGIGSGIARRFGEAGATVAVHYHRSEKGAQELAGEIEGGGGRAIVLAADLTRRDQVEGLVAAAVRELGGVDVLINNAGIYPLSPLLEMPDEEWDAVVDANLRATFLCTQAVARHMRDTARRGAIVDIASIEAHHPAPSHSHYDAAKAAVVMHARHPGQRRLPGPDLARGARPGLAGGRGPLSGRCPARPPRPVRGRGQRLPVPGLADGRLDHRGRAGGGRRRDEPLHLLTGGAR